MKGLILAGGTASRLHPTTIALNKHLLPIYNKPLIYYSLSTLMLINVKDVLITCHSEDLKSFEKLLGNGSSFGIKITYEIQDKPGGIAEVLLIAEKFLKDVNRFVTILGDNIFYIPHIRENLSNLIGLDSGAGIVLSGVSDPHRFGIAEFDKDMKIIGVEEKPRDPKSNFAITGLYFYDKQAIDFAKNTTRSARGELEITSINNEYLKKKKLNHAILPRGSVWLDAGTPNSMFAASEFVKIIEERQQTKIAVIEEVAYNMGYINHEILTALANRFKINCEYGDYLKKLISKKI